MKLFTITGDESTRIIKPGNDAGTISNPLGCFIAIWVILLGLAHYFIYFAILSIIQSIMTLVTNNGKRNGIVNMQDHTIHYKLL